MEDAQLLELLETDSDEALGIVKSRYSALVKLVVSQIVSDAEDCEEAVSDTFIKLWRTRKSIDLGLSSLKTYICTVARSCALNKLRGKKVCEPIPENENDLGVEIDYTGEAAKSINRRIVAECISALPQPDKNIFIYRYYYNMQIKAIAEKTDTDQRRVEYILSRGRERLKDALLKGGVIL